MLSAVNLDFLLYPEKCSPPTLICAHAVRTFHVSPKLCILMCAVDLVTSPSFLLARPVDSLVSSPVATF